MGKKARQKQLTADTPVPARPAEPPHDPNAWTAKDRRYWPAVGGVLALGAALRLLWLDRWVFQHDEAIYSIFSQNFRDYNFDPTYHGPTLYHILKLFFLAFGDSDLTARLVSVVMAFITFALILGPARRWLGDRGALFALGLHAISPVLVTYQRRILFDAFVIVLTFGAVLLAQKIRAAKAGTWAWTGSWVGLVALLTAFLATKANSFFVIAMLFSFSVAVMLRGVGPRNLGVRLPSQLPILMFAAVSAAAIFWGPRYPEDMALTKKHENFLIAVCVAASAFLWEWLRRTGHDARVAKAAAEPSTAAAPGLRVALTVWLCLAAGGLVYFFFFGHGYLWLVSPSEWSWSRYWPDVQQAMNKMLAYWGGQQKAPRLPGRHDFYLPLLIAYELPILIAFIGGVVRASRFRAPFTDLLLWWSFTSWTLYAMANEKVPWLMTHLVAPFALLGGWWLGQLRLTANGRKVFAAAGLVSVAFLLRNVSATNFERAIDNREPMFYAFTAESFGDAMWNAVEIAKTKTGDIWIYNAWPPSWYMRPNAVAKILAPAVAHYPEHEPPAGPLRFIVCQEGDWQKYREERFSGWHTWTWDKKTGGMVPDVAGAENPHILNWPRLSWYSFRPDLFLPWFFARKAEIPVYPPAQNHNFFTNTAFLTEWSHIPVVVATPP
jgi:predicted membrane-bound mannosyltransferase